MRIKTTYTQLNFLLTDIQQQSLRSPSFSFFNHDKISALNDKNKHRIKLLQDGMKAITDKHCQKDESGNPLVVNGNFAYNDEAAKESFMIEWADFGKQEFEINI